MNHNNVKIWDLFIRIFHWTLAVAFVVSYLTEGEVYLHFYSGWYIALLLTLRIIWGFIGTKHARFVDFIRPPTEIISYTKTLFQRKGGAKKYSGHNPLGGLMTIALLFSLSLTCYTGTMLYTSDGNAALSFLDQSPLEEFEEDEEHHPDEKNLKASATEEGREENKSEEFWEELHEFFANFTLFLIILHIAGVIVSSRLQGENLVEAMVTGDKEA